MVWERLTALHKRIDALVAINQQQANKLADLRRQRHSDLCQCTCPPEKFPQALEARKQKLQQLAEECDAIEKRVESERIVHQIELRHYAQEEARLANVADQLMERYIAIEAETDFVEATLREANQKYRTLTRKVLLGNEQLDELRGQVEVMQQAADQVQEFEKHQNHLHALREKRSATKRQEAERMLQGSNEYARKTQQDLQTFVRELDELHESLVQQTPQDPGNEQVLVMIREIRQSAVTGLARFKVAAASMHVELARAARQEPCPEAAAIHEAAAAAAAADGEEQEAEGASWGTEAKDATEVEGASVSTEAEGGGGAAGALHEGGGAEEAAAHVPHRLLCRKRKQTGRDLTEEGRTKRVCLSKAEGMSRSLPTAASVAGPSAMEVDAVQAPSEEAQAPAQTEVVEEEQVQHAAAAGGAAAGVGTVPDQANGHAAGRHKRSGPAGLNNGVASQLEGGQASGHASADAGQAVRADEAASSPAAADSGTTLRRSKRKQDASQPVEEEECAKWSRGLSGKRNCAVRVPVEQPAASTATADPAPSSSAAAVHKDADSDFRQGKGSRKVVQLRRSARLQQAGEHSRGKQ